MTKPYYAPDGILAILMVIMSSIYIYCVLPVASGGPVSPDRLDVLEDDIVNLLMMHNRHERTFMVIYGGFTAIILVLIKCHGRLQARVAVLEETVKSCMKDDRGQIRHPAHDTRHGTVDCHASNVAQFLKKIIGNNITDNADGLVASFTTDDLLYISNCIKQNLEVNISDAARELFKAEHHKFAATLKGTHIM